VFYWWNILFLCQKHGLLDQQTNGTCLVKLEKNATDIYKISQEVYGLKTIRKTQVFVRMKLFQDAREDVTDHE
jgi:hypothetical protein